MFAGTVAVILVTAVVVDLAVVSTVQGRMAAEIEQRVREQAPLVAALVERTLPPGSAELDAEPLERVARELPGSRITIVAPDGRVLFDTHEDPAVMDNHANRPEIRDPRRTVTRYSHTLGKRMTYHSLPVERDGTPVAHARVALAAAEIEERIGELRWAIRTGVLLAGAVGLVLAFLFARHVTKPLTEITAMLGEVGRADAPRRIAVSGHDEIAQLAHAINGMADELRDRVARVARDEQEKDAILGGLVEGLVAVDAEQRVVLMNAAARELMRVAVADPKGRPIWEVTRVPEITRAVGACIDQGRRIQQEAIIEAEGGERVIELTAGPIAAQNGAARGCVIALHDLTNLRRLEKVRREFVANVSHELKTPLTSMRGFVETVLEDPDMDPRTRRAFLSKALASTDRLAAIVRDLLSLARIESEEEGALRFEALDLVAVARDCARDNRAAAEAKRIRLELREPDEELPVSADREALGAAIGNLLDNAVKYSPERSRVRVAFGGDAERVWVAVEDEGPGIPPAEQQRIFERFYRVDRDRSRRLGGTGLGLSIVRNVVAVHGGEVELDSAVGRGSVFRIELPRKKDEAVTDRPA